MKVTLEWYPPLELTTARSPFVYSCNLEMIPQECGVYIFARKYGTVFEYLYIGQTTNVRNRIKNHLNSISLMGHIKNSSNGKRYLIYSKIQHHKNTDTKGALKIAERALIDFALSQQHSLLNKQGTRRPYHTIASEFPPGYSQKLGLPKETYTEHR